METLRKQNSLTSWFFLMASLALIIFVALLPFVEGKGETGVASYSRGVLHVNIPYNAELAGAGRLTVEVLDPENKVLGSSERLIAVKKGAGTWKEEIKLNDPVALEDLVWDRVRYSFDYRDGKNSPIEGTEVISQILRTPVIRIIGQKSFLAGAPAAVRVIVTDSKGEVIAGGGSVKVELLKGNAATVVLCDEVLNQRGTTDAEFRLPKDAVGDYQLHYIADTAIGATEFTQSVRIEDKVSILLTTEKPIYQPGQTIHVRALALDRADHEASANRKMTFEVEDSRGNKVFKKQTETSTFGVASAEFTLADEVNLGTYHLRALMGDADAPTNRAEIALNVERYVLPKFKVAVDLSGKGNGKKRGYRPGDHVTGTIRANYFFGKPVEGDVTVKASAMDVQVVEVATTRGKTDGEGAYKFDIQLPEYFVGRPLSGGAARVLIEATVKDTANHSETRGEPITVSESPLLITAVPEGGKLVRNIENQVFLLASYPDGTPAKAEVVVRGGGKGRQHVSTDDGGVAIVSLTPTDETERLKIDASDKEGNRASSTVELESRNGESQVLLRAERAVYRAGDAIRLKVFSTQSRGTAYVDVVKEGQTLLTRDLDLEDGQAELTLTATPDMAGTVDFNAYLFGRDAQAVGDHRLVFVQPSDELKIETVADAKVYKPGDEARIRFRVTNSKGEGVQAALGLQVVDEAVFALAEKQPGFAKVFFYLEQELMKPRYEIHSIGMPEVVDASEISKADEHDRAARALFSATEMLNDNKFETEAGRNLPTTKYNEYMQRYQVQFQKQVKHVAEILTEQYARSERGTDAMRTFDQAVAKNPSQFRDAWATPMRLEKAPFSMRETYYFVRSAGMDKQFNTVDDQTGYLGSIRRRKIVGPETWGESAINATTEQDRGPVGNRGEIVGTAFDQWGGALEGAKVRAQRVHHRRARVATVDADGRFRFAALPPGEYEITVFTDAENLSKKITVGVRDRVLLVASLRHQSPGAIVAINRARYETVTVEASVIQVQSDTSDVSQAVTSPQVSRLATNGRNILQLTALVPGAAMEAAAKGMPARGVVGGLITKSKKEDSGGNDTPHVRSYFPEALYINPEIVTDQNGEASITIPMADSITTWRMAMLASTQHGLLGSATSSLKVFQDFFVDLDLPVTLTQGDRVSIPVAIYNYSGATGEVSLHLEPSDWYALAGDVGDKKVTVESDRVGGSQFTVEAKRIGKFKLTLSAKMNGEAKRADIVIREIEVVPNGREQNIVFNDRLENTLQHQVAFPENSIADASKIFVRLYPGPLSQVIEGMDSILRMPGGCFEQTSSSTYPNVLALDYMKRTKKLTPEVHAKAEGYIANGYQRLLTFEVPGGGFSWFGQAPANKILTAYGLMEFYDMSKVYDVDPKVIQRTQQWLASQQQGDGSWKPDTYFINEGATNRYNSNVLRITAYIAWALENTGYQGPTVENAKRYIENNASTKLDAYTLAVLANFAVDYRRDPDFTRRAMQMLLDASTEKGEQVWWNAEETSVYATGESAAIETTGLAAQALLKWGEASGTVRKVMAYITSKKNAYGAWDTTQATIMALRSLILASEKAGGGDVRGAVEIVLNGKPVEQLELTPENNDLFHQFVFKQINQQSANKVEIRFSGKGGLACQIVGTYFLPWGEKPEKEPLSIAVKYDRTRLTQNDIVTAVVAVKNNMAKSANMVMVDLGIPPGFDLLSEDLQEYQEKSAGFKSGRLQKFSQTATQAILYFDSVGAHDTVTLQFRLRAKYPIRARTFKSRVYEYYDPSVSSVARPIQLEVRGK